MIANLMALPRHPLCQYPKARDELIFRQIDEDYVVYDPVADRTALLNLSAAAVLDLCDGARNIDEITAEIAETFGAALAEIRPKVELSLQDLMVQKFLE